MSVTTRAMTTIVAACFAGLAFATAIYAIFVVAFIIETPSLVRRNSLTARLSCVLIVCVVVLALAIRIVSKSAVPRRWPLMLLTALVTAVSFFTLYLYPIWTRHQPDRERQELRAIAAAIATSDHRELKLPHGYSYAIVRSVANGEERLTIQASDRLVARVMGIDMIALDNVVVELDTKGHVKRAWVDYF